MDVSTCPNSSNSPLKICALTVWNFFFFFLFSFLNLSNTHYFSNPLVNVGGNSQNVYRWGVLEFLSPHHCLPSQVPGQDNQGEETDATVPPGASPAPPAWWVFPAGFSLTWGLCLVSLAWCTGMKGRGFSIISTQFWTQRRAWLLHQKLWITLLTAHANAVVCVCVPSWSADQFLLLKLGQWKRLELSVPVI